MIATQCIWVTTLVLLAMIGLEADAHALSASVAATNSFIWKIFRRSDLPFSKEVGVNRQN